MAFSVPFFIGVAIWAKRQHAEPLGKHDNLMVIGLCLIRIPFTRMKHSARNCYSCNQNYANQQL
jgi:hypothetical protein